MIVRLPYRVVPLLIATLICAFLTAVAPASAQDLPKEAQAPFERGVAAARQNEWALAIKYFKQAEDKAKTDERILFNLAVALDRAGGHELGAIARYRAFLVASPQGAHADTARKRIEALEIRVEANVLRLIEKAKQAAAALPKEYQRNAATETIATSLARIGSVEDAKRLIGNLKDKDNGRRQIAEAQARNGDFAGAKSTAGSISGKAKTTALITIAGEQAKAGQLEAARTTADSIAPPLEQADAYIAIADAMVKAGHSSDALPVLAAARSAADRAKANGSRKLRYERMVPLFAAAGDTKTAEQLAPLAVDDTHSRNTTYFKLVKGLARANQFERARHYLPEISDKNYKKWAEESIARALKENLKAAIKEDRLPDAMGLAIISGQPASGLLELADTLVRKGDRAKALSILQRARETATGYEFGSIASKQLALGDIAAAKETAERAKGNAAASSWKDIAEFQLETGDANGAKKSLARAFAAIKAMQASERTSTAYYVVKRYVASGDMDGARRVADLISTPDYRSNAYRDIARAGLERGAIADAIKAAASIPENDSRENILDDIVNKQIQNGQIDAATVTAGKIDNSKWRARALTRLMEHYQKLGRWKDAEATVSGIKNDAERAAARVRQATLFFYYPGAIPQSRTALAAALETANKIDSASERSSKLRTVADYAQTYGDLDTYSRAIAMARSLISQMKKANSRDWARKSMAELIPSHDARALIEQIEGDGARAGAYRTLAQRLHREEDNASALAMMQRAIAIARSLPDERDALYEIEYNISLLSSIHEFDAALALAQSVSDPADQEKLLARIANQAISAKQPEAAMPWLQKLGAKRAYLKATVYLAVAEKQLANDSRPAAALMIGYALKVVPTIEDENSRASLLLKIADVQFKGGNHSGAEASIADFRKLLPLISSSSERRSRMEQLAKVYVASNRWKLALELARAEKKSSDRDSLLRTIATDLREAKEFDATAQATSEIHDVSIKESIYGSLVYPLTVARQFDAAGKIVDRIKDPYRNASASYTLASALIRNKNAAAAEKAIRAIRADLEKVMPHQKDTLRGWSAGISVQLNRLDEARAQADQIAEISPRSGVYRSIADAILKKGDAVAALETLRTMHKSTGLADPGDGWARWQFSRLVKDGADAEAEAIRITDPLMRSAALKDVVNRFMTAKDYDRATAAAARIPDTGYRSIALQAVVNAADQEGDVESALAAAFALPLSDRRDQALGHITRSLANKGQLGTAGTQARKITDPAARAFTFTAIALAAVKLGHADDARAPLGEAIDAARSITDDYLAALAFADAAYAYLDAGDRTSAQKLLAFDERLARDISNTGLRNAALRRLFGERPHKPAKKRDPVLQKEIKDRVSFIHYQVSKNKVYSDFPAYLNEVASVKDPSTAVNRLAGAAVDLGTMVKRLKRMDEDWAKRSQAAYKAQKAQ